MPASWRTFTHAARHCSSVPYSCSNSASVSPCMIARIAPIPCLLESILHRFRGGRKGGDWLISGGLNGREGVIAVMRNGALYKNRSRSQTFVCKGAFEQGPKRPCNREDVRSGHPCFPIMRRPSERDSSEPFGI